MEFGCESLFWILQKLPENCQMDLNKKNWHL